MPYMYRLTIPRVVSTTIAPGWTNPFSAGRKLKPTESVTAFVAFAVQVRKRQAYGGNGRFICFR